MDRSMATRNLGLTPKCHGARIYTDADGDERVVLTTPEEEAIQMLFDGLGVGGIRELAQLVDAGREVQPIRVEREDDPNTILRWIEAGFPPWGCHHCRGAEYGPDGVPCPSCLGRSDLIQPPERAAKILAMFNDAQHRAARDATA